MNRGMQRLAGSGQPLCCLELAKFLDHFKPMQITRVLLLASGVSCAALKRWEFVSFGDSFSDTGNVYRITNHTWPSPTVSGHFSNGMIWTEYLAAKFGATLQDFSFGGATVSSTKGYSGRNSDIAVPNVQEQISTYLTIRTSSDSIQSDDFILFERIHIILAGANDYFFDRNATSEAVTDAMIQNIQLLVEKANAKKFIIPQLPDISLLPYVQEHYDIKMIEAVKKHNSLLAEKLSKLVGITIAQPNFYSFMILVASNPATYGFKNARDSYQSHTNESVADFVFWDSFHFTTKFNQQLSNVAYNEALYFN